MSAKYEPKTPITLAPPRDDPITLEELRSADGMSLNRGGQVLTHPQGIVFDVTGNKAYVPGGSYHVFAGKDASRGLAKSSVKPEDATAEWEDLGEDEKKVLDDWFTFFSKRYNIVGKVVKA
ncbi:cytochrome b5-like Heme/Steroid binding domain-containing protein [Ascodesmis nigricans]|uniref:Cytochrome b5-like Heme/Steroid binding domain-containing protein n=1 Tax=Ascodesmis nigricans TaxID=341454 RepID=A0A4S2MP38_9PEZI|nr:cytochrome b5-like Heme/Steroid binding domain-containing protein [Ascodesmis nigricans]